MQQLIVGTNAIAYTDINNSASFTLFFLHGNSNSSGLWQEQVKDVRFRNYRLVLFDLPWHGDSHATEEEDCNVLQLGRIMAEAVKRLQQGKPYMLIGLSLGSNILAEMLAHGLSPDGIVVIGASLVGSGITPADVVNPGAGATVLYEDEPPAALVEEFLGDTSLHADALQVQMLREDYYRVKTPFRSLLRNSIPAGLYADEIGLIRRQQVPVLAIYGAEEKITSPSLLDRTGWEVVKIPDASHLVVIDQADEFNRILFEFTARFNED